MYRLLILILLLPVFASAQRLVTVADSISKEAMPFVKILPNEGPAFFTNFEGNFTLPETVASLTLRFQGYPDTTLSTTIIGDTIFMSSKSQIIEEVVVVAGENPAHRIIDQVIANRKKNHPMENDAFTYDSYSKFIFDADDDFKASVTDTTKQLDSTKLSIQEFLNNQYIFLMESASHRRFIPPSRDREDIIGYKVSGINHPMFITFMHELKSFHFYDVQFELAGTNYSNPIALGGTKRYLFQLQDTTIQGLDTTFTISFRPRKGKNFSGLQGQLFINTNGYAIEKVIAEAYNDTNSLFNISIVQEYKLLDGKKWFPYQLSTKANFYSLILGNSDNSGYLIGRGNTTIKNIQINPEDLKKRGFDGIELATEPDADQFSNEEWDAYRDSPLSKKEEKTYTFNDSVAKAENLDKIVTGMEALLTGKIRIKKVNLLLDRIIDFNQYEGTRLGLGLETSNLVMKNMRFGGYLAYGFWDLDFKYGGYYQADLHKRSGLTLTASYYHDLLQRGSTDFYLPSTNVNSEQLWSHIYRHHFDFEDAATLRLSFRPRGNMFLTFHGKYQQVNPIANYTYLRENQFETGNYTQVEVGAEWHWNIRQRITMMGTIPMPNTSNFPEIKVQYANGISGTNNYHRVQTLIQEKIDLGIFGDFQWSAKASKVIGEVPLLYQFTPTSSFDQWGLSIPSSFETVIPGRFYHQEQLQVFTRYYFPEIRTKLKWTQPQFFAHHAFGYGSNDGLNTHNLFAQQMNKWYSEVGVGVNRLYVSGISGIGVGAFYNYGYYAATDWKQNIIPKITISLAF